MSMTERLRQMARIREKGTITNLSASAPQAVPWIPQCIVQLGS